MNTQQKARLDCLAAELEFEGAIREMASALCHRAFAQDIHQRRSAEAVVASALYAAARLEDRPHDLSEIAAVASVDRAEIGRSYKDLSRLLDLDTEVVDPSEFVPRFCSTLGVSDDLASLAQEIATVSVDTGSLSGCSPAGIAAGAVYLAGRLIGGDSAPIQADVADVAQVTEVTVRNRYQDQEKLLGFGRPYSRSQTSPDESIGVSAEVLNEHLSRFEIIETESDLFDSRARCCRCGHIGPYRYLLRNHQPERFGGNRLCREAYFSAADLANQLEQFEAVDEDAEFEIVEARSDLDELRIRCIHCGVEDRYGELARQHETRWYNHRDYLSCYDRS